MLPAPALNTGAIEVGCVDDTPRCLQHRKTALAKIMNDKKRGWVSQQPTAGTYASGVRMFAFMKLKRKLSCPQLQIGLAEARRARPVLRGARNSLTNGQVARGALLGDEVAKLMHQEMKRRGCRQTT